MRKKVVAKKIVAVDFDGTLHRGKYPFINEPNTELIEYLKANRDKYILILHTMREGVQLEYAKKWLAEEQGLEFDYFNENVPYKIEQYGDKRKIYADIYVDDASKTSSEFVRGELDGKKRR